MNETQKKRAISAFTISNIMAGMEGTIIATALPSMMADLHGIQLMAWVIASYMLTMAISSPIWTKLAERFGHKQIFITGTAIFVLSSLMEGLSISMPMLIFARLLMGIGSGAMLQIPFVIYGLLLKPDERRKAFGNATGGYSIAAAVGPLIGGLIVSALGWRWVFFINIPIGLFMIYQIAKNFHFEREHKVVKIDYFGSIFLSSATIFLMIALQFMGSINPNWTMIISFIVLSIVLYTGLILVERKVAEPIIPLELFRNRSFMMKNLLMFLQYGFFGFYTNYLPTWGQGSLGLTAFMGGLILVPGSVTLFLSSRLVNPVLGKLGKNAERKLTTIGLSLMVLGDLILILLPQHTSMIWLMIGGAILGTSTGLTNGVVQVAVQESVEKKFIGAATALNALIRTLGTTLILSALSVSLNLTFSNAVHKNHHLTINLINQISDSTAIKNIASNLIEPLRHVMYNGLHGLALIGIFILLFAIAANYIDPWKKA